MKRLKEFDLSQLSKILDPATRGGEGNGEHDDQQQIVSNYISEHLLVALNPPVAQLMKRLSGDTFVMPEMRVMILTKGFANPIVNLTEHHFEAGQMIFLSQNSILMPTNYSNDVSGFGVSLTDEIARMAFPAGMPKLFDGHVRDCHFKLTTNEMQLMANLHKLLYDVHHSCQASPQTVLSLTAAFLWQADELWNRHENEQRDSLSREQRLFTDFIQLVSRYATQEHNIDFYAQRLFLSPRYMSTLVKKVSGKAAKQWIDDAIVTRIKVELRHTDKSAAQIADEMNFPNPSFFCKYFKRMTGLTTQAYRGR